MFALLFATAGVIANPPGIVLFERNAVAYPPGSQQGDVPLYLPVGTVIELCADEENMIVRYALDARAVRLVRPCQERPIFADGFED